MYNCRLTNDEGTIVVFKLYEPNMVIVETYDKQLGWMGATATSHEEAESAKDKYLNEGFTEV